MAEKKYNILKAASWYTIGNILIKGVSFFCITNFHIPDEHYGLWNI